MSRKIFVNLPVGDLPRAKAFWSHLGFAFHEQYTNEVAACVVISDAIYVMLLTHEFFAGFAPKPISDARASTEVLLCLSCDSREQVDDLVRLAVEAGGRTYNDPQENGTMYGHGFEDPDGHVWELGYMPGDQAT
ncbi:MAG: VOC family protein [Armatimonadetes bacterium]|nr:VOC family protein [Armatimonadota bacterium]